MNPYRSINANQRASMRQALTGAMLADDTATAWRLARLVGHADATTDDPTEAADYAHRAYDEAFDFAHTPSPDHELAESAGHVDRCRAAYALLTALESIDSTPPAPANSEAV